jgi:hypothetical protein
MDETSPPLIAVTDHQESDTETESNTPEHEQDSTKMLGQDQQEEGKDHFGEDGSTAVDSEARESLPSPASTLFDSKSLDDIHQRDDTFHTLILERDQLEANLNRAHRQLNATCSENSSLSRQVRDLRLQFSEGISQLAREIATLWAEKRQLESKIAAARQEGLKDGLRTQCVHNERLIFIQQIEAYKAEAAKWKHEALGKGSELMNICWKASVDQAVARKREGDQLALRLLYKENVALKAAMQK